MLFALAQLHCTMELAPVPPALAAAVPANGGTPWIFEYRDALTGVALGRREVAQLPPVIRSAGNDVAPTLPLEEIPDLGVVRGAYAVDAHAAVSLGVAGSVRYFGCSSGITVEGTQARRVVISLVPRARDVAVHVEVHRDTTSVRLSPKEVSDVDLRPDAAAEGDAEVHAGRCSGEPPPRGESFWCVRFVRAEPTPVDLAVRVPGYGITRVRLDPTDAARTVVLDARYDGHIGPSATVRIAAGVGLVGGSSASFYGAIEAAAPAGLFGNTCPHDVACVRPVAHLGLAWLPYSRNTSLLGPGSQVAPDGSTAGTLMALEVGAGLTILPPGTGDRFRATVLVSGLVAGRTEERDTAHGNLLLSPATTVLGAVAELVAGIRLFDGFMLNAGARVNYVPTIGSAGRQFSYLGNAQAASSTTSLVSVGVIVGLGIEL